MTYKQSWLAEKLNVAGLGGVVFADFFKRDYHHNQQQKNGQQQYDNDDDTLKDSVDQAGRRGGKGKLQKTVREFFKDDELQFGVGVRGSAMGIPLKFDYIVDFDDAMGGGRTKFSLGKDWGIA